MNNTFEVNEETKYEHSNIKLWNPKGFTYIGVLFSFLPAAILYSINYGRLSLRKERTYNLLGYSLFIVLLMMMNYSILKE